MASDDEDDETNDPTYEYDTRSDRTDDYPALSGDGMNAPSSFIREGIEPWYPRGHDLQLSALPRAAAQLCHPLV